MAAASRHLRLSRRGAGAQFHPRGGAARGVAIGVEPNHARRWKRGSACRLLTRITRSVSPTEAGERLIRAVGPRLRGDRCRTGRAERDCGISRPAPSASPPRSCGRAVLWPVLGSSCCRLSRYQGGNHRRLRPDRHRRRALRCRRAAGRAGRQGHDGGAHRPRHAHGRRRRAVLFRRRADAADAAGPDRP